LEQLIVYGLNVAVYIGIFAIIAVSLNLEYGFTGLGNFGKAGFFLIGAYAYALVATAGLPSFLSIIVAASVCAIVGLLISLPALKLREDYLAIVTLTFAEIIRTIVKSEKWIANGVWGIGVPAAINTGNASYNVGIIINLLLVYGCLSLVLLFAEMLTNSPYGRIIRGIREDEDAIDALGKSKSGYKAQVLMTASAIAGIAGALFGQYVGYIEPNMFVPILTFTIWIMVILGGPANNWGVILGAALEQLFERGTKIIKDYIALPVDPNNLQYILFGILIILILLYRPAGLLSESKVKTAGTRSATKWLKHS